MDAFLVAKMEKLLVNRLVTLWLSPEGKVAVKEIFQGKEKFIAHVQLVDQLGVWLRMTSKKGSTDRTLTALLLLKWEYLATAEVGTATDEVAPEGEKRENSVGDRTQWQRKNLTVQSRM